MTEDLVERGAEKLVAVNARVKPGESVIVVTDDAVTGVAARLARAAGAAGAQVTTCHMSARFSDGQEPPPPVAAAMLEAAIIFSPVSVSITHTRAMRAALNAGARAVLLTAYTEEFLASPALLDTDFERFDETLDLTGKFIRVTGSCCL